MILSQRALFDLPREVSPPRRRREGHRSRKMGDDVSTNTVSIKAPAAARRPSDTLQTVGVTGPFALARAGVREGDESLIVGRAHRWLGERVDTFEGFPVVWWNDY